MNWKEFKKKIPLYWLIAFIVISLTGFIIFLPMMCSCNVLGLPPYFGISYLYPTSRVDFYIENLILNLLISLVIGTVYFIIKSKVKK